MNSYLQARWLRPHLLRQNARGRRGRRGQQQGVDTEPQSKFPQFIPTEIFQHFPSSFQAASDVRRPLQRDREERRRRRCREVFRAGPADRRGIQIKVFTKSSCLYLLGFFLLFPYISLGEQQQQQVDRDRSRHLHRRQQQQQQQQQPPPRSAADHRVFLGRSASEPLFVDIVLQFFLKNKNIFIYFSPKDDAPPRKNSTATLSGKEKLKVS